jgi:CheY-like chemotaxis protein
MGTVAIPQQKNASAHELTPRDDAKKLVSEVLKRVDQLIRKGDLERAQAEISKAKEIDPRNVYALALEERISILRTEADRLEEVRHGEKAAPIPVVEHHIDAPPAPPPAPLRQIATQSPPPPPPTFVNSNAPMPSQVQSANAIAVATKKQGQSQLAPADKTVEMESYRKALTEAWVDGVLNPNEDRQLSELRLVLEITDDEHERLEKNVKRECYRSAILQQLSSNPASISNSKSLSELQRLYKISEEDHQHVQQQLLSVMQHKQREKVLVVDDDARLLDLLAASLEDSGFDVTALPTSDEAFALLRKFIPDLILCDINLETSTMGGFTFYEKVQELKNVQNVPFVFLTGLTDEALVRAGKELGVDDYLMKPISEQTLISTLRGKLKRFKQLRKLIDHPIPTMAMAS